MSHSMGEIDAKFLTFPPMESAVCRAASYFTAARDIRVEKLNYPDGSMENMALELAARELDKRAHERMLEAIKFFGVTPK